MPSLMYPEWKAPAADGELLIWPEPSRLLEDTRQNHHLLQSAQSRIQNIPLAELRQRMRNWLGHQNNDQPLVASGHQTELYHPGVWVKDALGDAVAKKLDGAAYHFSVDTDKPKHLLLRWPDANRKVCSFPITDDPDLATAEWAGLLDAPSPAHIDAVARAVAESRFSFRPMLPEFLNSMRRLSLETPSLASALTNATHELSWSLGLRHHALLCSPVWNSEPYLAFAHHLLARPIQFARDYNAALADYRRAKKIRTPSRPMPDLNLTPTSCEVPFWLDDLSQNTRIRAQVWIDQNDNRFLVAPGGEEFALRADRDGWDAAQALNQFLRRNNIRLSPRALTLTLVLRLLVVDNFIHGIGGGRYDQVTDRLIASHFGIEPPRFAVTTATLYFPDAVGRPRACLPCVKREGHQLRHALLGDRKRELVSAIAAAPRYSLQRRTLFSKMRQELNQLAVQNPVLGKWEQTLRDTEREASEEQILFDRELFFALQPRDRLESLIARCGASVRTS